MTEARISDYWFSPTAIYIQLNAVGDPNYIHANCSSGSAIICHVQGIPELGFDNAHNYKRFTLTASPTIFHDNQQRYVYIAIPKSARADTVAQVVFPHEHIDIYGVNDYGEQVGLTEYLYINTRGIISPSEIDGVVGNRFWVSNVESGTLATDEAIMVGGDSSWWEWNAASDMVKFLKRISYAFIQELEASSATISKLILGKHTLKGVATDSGDEPTTDDSDDSVVTPLFVSKRYLPSKKPGIAQKLITFLSGLRVGNFTSGRSGAAIDADGNAEVETLEARKEVAVGERLTVGDFRSGVSGGAIWVDETGRIHVETDYMTARVKFRAKEVEIQEETHVGGSQAVTPAGMRCSRVEEVVEGGSVVGYKCFFNAADNDGLAVSNQFAVGDLARCETFNLERDAEGYVGNRYYWRKVVAVGTSETDGYGKEHWILLSNRTGEMDESVAQSTPAEGDSIVTLGNDSDPERQCAVVISAYGEGAPYIFQFAGINTFSLNERNIKTAISPNGNKFTGDFLLENGITLADFLRADYDAKFEATDKKIEAQASKVTANEKDIASLLVTAQGIASTVENVTGMVDEPMIFADAGRNLLLGTNQGTKNWRYGHESVTPYTMEEDADGGVVFKTSPRDDAGFEVFYFVGMRSQLIKYPNAHKLSFRLANRSAKPIAINVAICRPENDQLLTNIVQLIAPADSEDFYDFNLVAVADGWPKGTQVVRFGVVGAYIGRWTEIAISDLMLTLGTELFPWAAAPEDSLPEGYRSLKTQIDQTADSIKLIAKNFDEQGNVTSESGIMTTAQGNAMYAFDAQGNLVSLVEQTPASFNISAKNINLSGYVTANRKVEITESGYLKAEDALVSGTLCANELVLGAVRQPDDTDDYDNAPMLTKSMNVCHGGYFSLPALEPGTCRELRILVMGKGTFFTRQGVQLTLFGNSDQAMGNLVKICQEGDIGNAADSIQFTSSSSTDGGKTITHYAYGIYLCTGWRLPADDPQATDEEKLTTYWNVIKLDDSVFTLQRLSVAPPEPSASTPTYKDITKPFDTIIESPWVGNNFNKPISEQ